MNVPDFFSVTELVAMENEVRLLQPSPDRDAKRNVLNYLLISKVKQNEGAYDDLLYTMRLEGHLSQLERIASNDSTLFQLRTTGSINEFLDDATRVKPLLDQLVQQVSETVACEVSSAPVKSSESAQRKAKKYDGDVRRITDMARTSIVCESPEDLVNFFEGCRRLPQLDVRTVRNGYICDYMPGGYRDVQFVVQVDDHLCEVQLHLRSFFSLKPAQHKVNEWARELKVTREMTADDLALNSSNEINQAMIELATRNWCNSLIIRPYLLMCAGRYEEALPSVEQWCFDAEVRVRECAEGSSAWRQATQEASTHTNNLVAIYNNQGRYADAEVLCNRSLEESRRIFGTHHPSVAVSLNTKAVTAKAQGLANVAEDLYRQALEASKRSVGENHPLTAKVLMNLATLLQVQAKHGEAMQHYRTATGILEGALGSDHLSLAACLNNMGAVSLAQGRYHDALGLFETGSDIVQRQLVQGHPAVVSALSKKAAAFEKLGNYTEAGRILGELLIDIDERRHSYCGELEATVCTNFARILERQGNDDAAAGLYRRSLDTYRRSLNMESTHMSSSHFGLATTLNNLVEILRRKGEHEEADLLYAEALGIYDHGPDGGHPDEALLLDNHARHLEDGGRFVEAAPLYKRSFEIRKRILGLRHPDVAMSLNNIAGWLEKQHVHSEAEPLYLQALDILSAGAGENHPNYGMTLNNLGICLSDQGKFDDADRTLLRVVEISPLAQLDPERAQGMLRGNRQRRARGHVGARATPARTRELLSMVGVTRIEISGSSPTAYGGLDFSSLLNPGTSGQAPTSRAVPGAHAAVEGTRTREVVETMLSMGVVVSPTMCEEALAATGGDLAAAVNLLWSSQEP